MMKNEKISQTRYLWVCDDLHLSSLVDLKLGQSTQILGMILKDLVAFVLQLSSG